MKASSGILKAARDLRATAILIRWGGHRKGIGKTFGNNIDPVIIHSDKLVMVNRISHAYKTANRILVLVPPLIDKQSGYEEMLFLVRSVAKNIQASLTIFSTEETRECTLAALKQLKSSVSIETVIVKDWKMVLAILDAAVKPNDMFFLLSARISKASWRPLLNKLPHWLVDRYDTNVSVIFPREGQTDAALEETPVRGDEIPLFRTFKKENFYFDLVNHSVREAIEHILYQPFHDDPAALTQLTALLTKIAMEESIELMEEVVLVHAHISQVKDHTIYIGVNREGYDIPGISGKIKVLIILLNSVNKPPEYHLTVLKEVVQIIRKEGFIDALKKAAAIDQFEKNWSDSPASSMTLPESDGSRASVRKRTT